MGFLEQMFVGNTLMQWLIAAGIAFGLWIFFQFVKTILVRSLAKVTTRTKTTVDDALLHALERTKGFLMLLVAIYFGSLVLTLPDDVLLWLNTGIFIVFVLQVGLWLDAAIIYWISDYQSKMLESNAAQVTTVRAVGYIIRVILFSLLLLLALDNLPGVEITPLLASLGVAGIAVSLALQGVLADLFASIAIALDKPFVINDFIIVGDFLGTVEKIGIKTTRLRSLGGEQLIFGNADLLSSRIRNYKRMEERRIVFGLGVTYDTPYEKLRSIPATIQEIVEQQEQARFDRAHFASYGDFSLNFEIVYYVLSADYNVYMDVQQAINLAIFKAFEEAGIEFAFPTRTLYVANEVGLRSTNGSRQPVPAEPDTEHGSLKKGEV